MAVRVGRKLTAPGVGYVLSIPDSHTALRSGHLESLTTASAFEALFLRSIHRSPPHRNQSPHFHNALRTTKILDFSAQRACIHFQDLKDPLPKSASLRMDHTSGDCSLLRRK